MDEIESIASNDLLVDVDTEDLPLLVDTNNAIGYFVLRSDKMVSPDIRFIKTQASDSRS